MTDLKIPNLEPSTALMSGSLDYISLRGAEGWAFNPAFPEQRVAVAILVDDREVWSGYADVLRSDLEEAGVGDGSHAFYATFDLGSLASSIDQVCIRALSGEAELTNSPAILDTAVGSNVLFDRNYHPSTLAGLGMTLTNTQHSSTSELLEESATARHSTQEFVGCLDVVTESFIRGWAFNLTNPDVSVVVDILDGDTPIVRATADMFRDDLKTAGYGNGRHSFIVPTPISLLDGRAHIVSARVTNTTIALSNSPARVTLETGLPFQLLARLQQSTTDGLLAFQKLSELVNDGYAHSIKQAHTQNTDYQRWSARYNAVTSDMRVRMTNHILTFGTRLMFSIVMPTYNTPRKFLEGAVESILDQMYPFWELCIADDASTSEATRNVLAELESRDSRIRVIYRAENGHISEATNSALAIASGDYICFMDHDDLLTPDALYQIAVRIEVNNAALYYSDEDKIDRRNIAVEPHFKPDFNYRLLLSYNYICHFLCVRRDIIDKVGNFRTIYNGSQDHDFLLRCCEFINPDDIVHIPMILYHWRAHEESTASNIATKNYALEAGKAAVSDHLNRVGRPASVMDGPFGTYKTVWAPPAEWPRVSAIIPTRDSASILALALAGLIYHTDYPNLQVIIVDNGSVEDDTFKLFDEMRRRANVEVVRFDKEFNYSEICNFGRTFAKGELLLMLNNDIEVLSPEWLKVMVLECMQPGVGAVGAKLLYPNGLVQHSGVILGIGGVAGHAHKYIRNEEPGYMTRNLVSQDLSACTAACLLIHQSVFDEIGGFDAVNLPVAFNDVDLCIRITEAGYRIVFAANAVLRHHESISRGSEDRPAKVFRSQKEVAYMSKAWLERLLEDKHYSRNLTLNSEDFSIDAERGCPRVTL